jgi:hypothetical protein
MSTEYRCGRPGSSSHPSNRWTPLPSSARSKEVFDDKSASEFHG